MTYEIIIESVSEIVNNDLIYKEGLVLEYKLKEDVHLKMDEYFFYKTNPSAKKSEFEHMDEFEIEIGGVTIRFIQDE